MKKDICFPVAYFTSVLMFISTNLFVSLNATLMQPLVSTRFFLIGLQVVSALRSTVLIIILMPGKPRVYHTTIGFIAADVTIMFGNLMLKNGFLVPLQLITVQLLLVGFYMAGQGKFKAYKTNAASINIKNELITGNI